ncbi:MAG: T9SS type A sorting domain-containing protein [Bacteroidetes bacterium]|nr:T9SS type A sorting domain-containing protein [Bacteroidota bacterium]
MKKIVQFGFVITFCLFSSHSFAQRYLTEIFTDVTVESDVKYAENYSVLTGVPDMENLLMDIYQPDGDTLSQRPLIIMAHAGSYLPKGLNTLPFGNKADSSMVEMCTQFAKRGWVAVSMNYRLGWNPLAPLQEDRAGTIMMAVYRSMQDVKACVRFFRKDAATDNLYKVDTVKITAGGSNTGGYAALTTAYLDKVEEINLTKFLDSDGNSFINQAIFGGFDGEDGHPDYNYYNHPGYTSDIQLVLNMGGAIGDTSWMEAGDIPVVAFHGILDPTTPYLTDIVIVLATGDPIVKVSGSYDIARYANVLNLQQVFIDAAFGDPYTLAAQNQTSIEGLFPFPGIVNSFAPWAWYDSSDDNIDNDTPGATGFGSRANPYATKEKALLYIDTIMGYFCPRAVKALGLDTTWLSVTGKINILETLSIFPNPATSSVYVESNSQYPIFSIELYNIMGQLVRKASDINSVRYRFERNNLPSGIYLMKVQLMNKSVTKRIIFK